MCIVFLLLPSNRYQTGVRIRNPAAGLLTYIVLQQGNQGINADTRIQTLSSQEMQTWQQEATRIDRLTHQNDPSDSFDPDTTYQIPVTLSKSQFTEAQSVGALCGTAIRSFLRHATIVPGRLHAAGLVTEAEVKQQFPEETEQDAQRQERETVKAEITQAEYGSLQSLATHWEVPLDKLVGAAALTLPVQLVRGRTAVAQGLVLGAYFLRPYRNIVYTSIPDRVVEGQEQASLASFFLAPVRLLFHDHHLPLRGELQSASEEEIERLEARLGGRLPGAYREFLGWMGHEAADLCVGAQYSVDCIPSLQTRAKALLQQKQAREALPADAVVFFFVEPSTFAFFRCSEGGDPPVYCYEQTRYTQTFYRTYEHLSDFVAAHVLVYAQIHQVRRTYRVRE